MSMSVDIEEHALLTKEQAAARLQISQRTLWTWGAEGRLEVVHLTPRTLRYTEQSVRALMTGQSGPDRADATRRSEKAQPTMEV